VEEDDEIKPLSADELARLLAAAERLAPWYYPLFCLMALAGLRLGEALALRRSSLDFVQREIRVSRTLAPPHHLRHSLCALLLGEGVPVPYVMTQSQTRA
jgi:integrase